jgi:hypothetical protein
MLTKEKTMEKKEKTEIGVRTSVKAIITGFVSYGIIANFLFVLLFTIVDSLINNFHGKTSFQLHITLPLIAVILLFFALRLICKLSTYDVFKKCKTNPDNYLKILSYLNIFFIFCITVSIIVFSTFLYINLEYQIQSINLAIQQYKDIFDSIHIHDIHIKMISQFNESKLNLTCSTIILDLGLMAAFLSLIPYQSKMLKKYNDYKKEELS